MKFKAILKCNCVFVYPSKEEVLNATSDNLATENNLAELKGCQQEVAFNDARPIGDLLDRGYGAHSLSNVEYALQPDAEDHVHKIRSHCEFGEVIALRRSSPVLSGAEIHDTSTIALSSSIPLIGSPPEATTLPDNTLDTIVESNKMDEVIMQEDIDDEDADDMDEVSDGVIEDDANEDIFAYEDEKSDAAAAVETIGEPPATDTLDQPVASIDTIDTKTLENDPEKSNTHASSSSLQLEVNAIEPANSRVSSTENRNNSGSGSSSSGNKRQTPRKRIKYVRRVRGPILLADEEAFYLCLNGHMIVYEDFNIENISQGNLTEVSLDALWSIMRTKNAKFPAKYKAYSFFRDQRFVVRSGMHFGVDFAVYRLLPTQCHSELCAHVVDAIASGGEDMSIRHLSTLTRVMPDVMKLLVLCYVLPAARPHNQTVISPSEADMDEVALSESSKDADKSIDAVEAEGSSTVPNTAVESKIGLSPQPCISRDDYLRALFPDSFADTNEEMNTGSGSSNSSCSNDLGTEDVDCSTYKCLDQLIVRPVTALVRRSSATTKSYSSVVTLHQRYRRLSILKKPREFVPNIAVYPRPPAIQQDAHTKPSLSLAMPDNVDGSSGVAQPPSQSQGPFKRRRDPTEVRHKAASKNNMLWAVLASDGEPELSPKSKKRLKKRKWIFKKFGNSKGFVR